MRTNEELAQARLDTLDAHLWSGDEWDLVDLRAEDLGLPTSTCEIRAITFGYNGNLRVPSRGDAPSDECICEYEFKLTLTVEALMDVHDAEALGWDYESEYSLGQATGELEMTGRVGIRYEVDEESGTIEYIGLRRTDGSVGSPLAPPRGRLEAQVYEFRPRKGNQGGPGERSS